MDTLTHSQLLPLITPPGYQIIEHFLLSKGGELDLDFTRFRGRKERTEKRVKGYLAESTEREQSSKGGGVSLCSIKHI